MLQRETAQLLGDSGRRSRILRHRRVRWGDQHPQPGPVGLRGDPVHRLSFGAGLLGFRSLPWSEEELREACVEVAAASGFRECYIRPLIYLAEGGWNLTIDAGKPHCGIACWEWKQYLGELLEKSAH